MNEFERMFFNESRNVEDDPKIAKELISKVEEVFPLDLDSLPEDTFEVNVSRIIDNGITENISASRVYIGDEQSRVEYLVEIIEAYHWPDAPEIPQYERACAVCLIPELESIEAIHDKQLYYDAEGELLDDMSTYRDSFEFQAYSYLIRNLGFLPSTVATES